MNAGRIAIERRCGMTIHEYGKKGRRSNMSWSLDLPKEEWKCNVCGNTWFEYEPDACPYCGSHKIEEVKGEKK